MTALDVERQREIGKLVTAADALRACLKVLGDNNPYLLNSVASLEIELRQAAAFRVASSQASTDK